MTRGNLRPTRRRVIGLAVVGLVIGTGLFVGGLVAATTPGDGAPGSTAGAAVGSGVTTTPPPPTTTTPPATAPSSTTTAAPVTTTTAAPAAPAPAADGTLEAGDSGPAVDSLQARLVELGYWLGTPDGSYGDLTRQAVLAFQKAEGLARDGTAGPATQERLATAQRPSARSTTGDGIEIDLDRQVLLVVRGGAVRWVLNTSTGAARTPTPAGQYEVDRQIDGMRQAPLGRLYRPKYFNGGIAIHGFPSVPAHAASHGCARVSYPAIDLLWAEGLAPLGTAVSVYGA